MLKVKDQSSGLKSERGRGSKSKFQSLDKYTIGYERICGLDFLLKRNTFEFILKKKSAA